MGTAISCISSCFGKFQHAEQVAMESDAADLAAPAVTVVNDDSFDQRADRLA